jgi:hypothetical protein
MSKADAAALPWRKLRREGPKADDEIFFGMVKERFFHGVMVVKLRLPLRGGAEEGEGVEIRMGAEKTAGLTSKRPALQVGLRLRFLGAFAVRLKNMHRQECPWYEKLFVADGENVLAFDF